MNIQIKIGWLFLTLSTGFGCGSSTDATVPPPNVSIDAVFLPYDSTDFFGGVHMMPGRVYGHFSNIPAGELPSLILISGKSPTVDIHDTSSFKYVNIYGQHQPDPKGGIENFTFKIDSGSGVLNGYSPKETIYLKAYGFTGYLHYVQEIGKRPIYSDIGPESNLITIYWEK